MKQETIEEAAENHINNDLDLYESLVDGYISYDIGMDLLNNLFINGAKCQQEKICNSEVIQRIRATKSDAEARRLILEQFKNK